VEVRPEMQLAQIRDDPQAIAAFARLVETLL
jgi:hypothetical protein